MHFGYGAAAAVLFSFLARPMSVGRGFAFGAAPWLMQGALVPGLRAAWFSFGLGHGHWLFSGYKLACTSATA